MSPTLAGDVVALLPYLATSLQPSLLVPTAPLLTLAPSRCAPLPLRVPAVPPLHLGGPSSSRIDAPISAAGARPALHEMTVRELLEGLPLVWANSAWACQASAACERLGTSKELSTAHGIVPRESVVGEGWSSASELLLSGVAEAGELVELVSLLDRMLGDGVAASVPVSTLLVTLLPDKLHFVVTRPIGAQPADCNQRILAERRLDVAQSLMQSTAESRTVADYVERTLQALALHPADIKFAILYSRHALAGSGSDTSSARFALQGCFGVRAEFAPSTIDIPASPSTRASTQPSSPELISLRFRWPLAEVLCTREPTLVAIADQRMTEGLPSVGRPAEGTHALMLPVYYEGASEETVLILGLSPFVHYDDIGKKFFLFLTTQIAAGLAAVATFEQDSRKTTELLALSSAQSSFFSNISHELRTPLTLILGPLDDVLSGKENLDPSDRERLVTVQRHSTRLLNMVNTLLDFSRLEGGKMEASFRTVQLGSMTSDLASLFRSAIERGGVKYVVDCEPDPTDGQSVYLAPDLWETVLCNLLSNAFKYCLQGTITVKVRFQESSALVTVEDTGCGIAADELGKIFERFHRVESTSRSYTGTGIGLALTMELTKILGGTIDVQSVVDQGSTFSVRIPRGSERLSPAELAPTNAPSTTKCRAERKVSIVSEAANWHVKALPVVSKLSGVPETRRPSLSTSEVGEDLLELKSSVVLVADDNDDLRRYVCETLSRSFTVVEVLDGQAALEYARKWPPSLIVSDVQMPRLNGFGLLSAIRADARTSAIPVIFLSALATTEARSAALEQGADDYVVKPFQSRELLARVTVHLQLAKLREALERRVELRTQALAESELRYKALADRYSTLSVVSPVGIFLTDEVGTVTYANQRWRDISGHPEDKDPSSWLESVHADDLEMVTTSWGIATSGRPRPPVRPGEHIQFRWKAGLWVQAEVRPFIEGERRGFVGAITDITHQKKVEALHIQVVEQRAADAEENRRQQELFIDMASHELRNPLSGVWQNAEVVGASLERMGEIFDDMALDAGGMDEQTLEYMRREIAENSEAIDSIILCTSHQARIADDILNMSKLRMNLLSIELIEFPLVERVREVVQMFEIESSQRKIDLKFEIGPSLELLQVSDVIADPNRIAQILINYLTNAIKCTSDCAVREITVQLAVSEHRPLLKPNTMRVPNSTSSHSPSPSLSRIPVAGTTLSSADGTASVSSGAPTPASTLPATEVTPSKPRADEVWVTLGVKDTGKGLSESDLSRLFARFSQANPKTDQYGGSGLGLFVSKTLVTLHKGFIEVESKLGEGSTFSFSIPASRVASLVVPPRPLVTSPNNSFKKRRPNGNIRRPSTAGAIPTGPIHGSIPPYLPSTSPPSDPLATNPLALDSPPLSPSPTTSPEDHELPARTSKFLRPRHRDGTEGPPIHVLVVEDNLINQVVMKRQLKLQHILVTIANHGQEALDILHSQATLDPSTETPISIVLMDIEMPVMDGLTAIRELRQAEREGKLARRYPVIAVTGNARTAQQEACLASGFDDVAIKPYKIRQLLEQIERLVAVEAPPGPL